MKKIESIQALRGIAVLLVVMFHLRTDLDLTFPGIERIFRYGAIGVDLFFMISGFIAYYVTAKKNDGLLSSREFLIKRLCRIVPPYIIATLFVAGSSLDAWFETLRSLVFLPNDITQAAPWFGYARLDVGWTLNYEFAFYVICTFAILFKRLKFTALTFIILFIVIAPYIINGATGALANRNYGYTGYLAIATNGMMLEFLAGILIAHLSYKIIIGGSKLSWGCAVGASSTYFLYVVATCFYAGNGNYGYVSASFLIILSLVGYEKRFGIKAPSYLIAIGAASFSIYLMHRRGMSVASKVIYNYTPGTYAGLAVTIISLLLTAVFSYLSYKYIEIKLCNNIRNRLLK